MSMVHLSGGLTPPASPHLLSEPAIVARLAAATLPDSPVPWAELVADYARIRDRIEAVFDDFHDFNRRVSVPGGFRLRNTASERVWATPSGKAEFRVHAVPTDTPAHRARAAADRVFTLTTVRSHDQYNTTVYGLDDRYRGVHGHRRVVFIHPDDLKDLGLRAGERVDLASVYGDGEPRSARDFLLVAYDIPRGCIASYYPETNPLVSRASYALGARTPASKSVPVVLTPARVDPDPDPDPDAD